MISLEQSWSGFQIQFLSNFGRTQKVLAGGQPSTQLHAAL